MSYILTKIRKFCNTKNNSRNGTVNNNLRNRKIDEMLDLTPCHFLLVNYYTAKSKYRMMRGEGTERVER